MFRKAVIATLVALAAGCAGLGAPPAAPDAPSKFDELSRSQGRMELRLDEVTRNLLALRERIEAQDTAIKVLREASREGKDAEREEPEPALPIVKVEPLADPKPPEVPPPLPRNPPSNQDASFVARAEAPADQTAASDLYRRAFNGFRENRFGQAILDFEDFLRRYPDHEYADNAQYWIGECYYSQKEYEEAVVQFGRVLDRYPRESKAPDALLKIGLCYQNLGDLEKARVFWRRLVSEHANTEAAGQARVLLGG